MFTTVRYTFKYGNEWDAMDCTFKDWNDLDKAIAYAHRYAKGIKFAGVTVEDETGNVIYEITSEGKVFSKLEK